MKLKILLLSTKPRMTKKLAAILVVAAGVVICSLVLFAGGQEKTKAVFANEISSKNIKTESDRVLFLEKLGWQVDAESVEVQDVVIPSQFNDTLKAYNEIQMTQGCDLARYAGKKVKRYSYDLKNHPSGEEGVKISLLIYNNTVIGGDICSTRLDGFMHGLTME
ncbi:MAG: DUF4830 domain-containing protein [Oscillospiraceae bacterium]|nr:DUF4830 domain-containing protein [Oscillospiraceae bacterium]